MPDDEIGLTSPICDASLCRLAEWDDIVDGISPIAAESFSRALEKRCRMLDFGQDWLGA